MAEGVGGNLVEEDQEFEGDFRLTTLVSQINDSTTKISKVEKICFEDMLKIILQKITNQE